MKQKEEETWNGKLILFFFPLLLKVIIKLLPGALKLEVLFKMGIGFVKYKEFKIKTKMPALPEEMSI